MISMLQAYFQGLFGGATPDITGSGNIKGTKNSDFIQGSDDADNVKGRKGDDYLKLGDGDDQGRGGQGDDWIQGEDGNDRLHGGKGDDLLEGGDGNDRLNGGRGDDGLVGGDGDDKLRDRWGNDEMDGGDGNDVLVSRSDAGEPEIAQETDVEKVYDDQPYEDADDILTGGDGADKFKFRLDINAKYEIAEIHADEETGEIDWGAVAGENDEVHDHWVDSIGFDIITDFNKAEGDTIVINGHTRQFDLETGSDENGTYTDILLYSEQGGAGAHQDDDLGTIRVYGDEVTEADVGGDAMATRGAYKTIDQMADDLGIA